MYRFYVLLEGSWEWEVSSSPYVMLDVEAMLQKTYGKDFVKKEYVPNV